MHWDVIEVKPEPNYCLFIRFKDGLAGRVQLPKDKLTGALSPLRDEHFFKQVFIDNGSVSCPGEIDLAPDAIYADIASRHIQQSIFLPVTIDMRRTCFIS